MRLRAPRTEWPTPASHGATRSWLLSPPSASGGPPGGCLAACLAIADKGLHVALPEPSEPPHFHPGKAMLVDPTSSLRPRSSPDTLRLVSRSRGAAYRSHPFVTRTRCI